MNGASGFHKARSSTSRSPSNHFLHEQRHQFETDSWHLLRTHNFLAYSTGISTERKKLLTPFSIH